MELKKIVAALSFALIAISSTQTFAATQSKDEIMYNQLITEELNKESHRIIKKITDIAPETEGGEIYRDYKLSDLHKQSFMYQYLINTRDTLKMELENKNYDNKKERIYLLIDMLANSKATHEYNAFMRNLNIPDLKGESDELRQKFNDEYKKYDYRSAAEITVRQGEFLEKLANEKNEFWVFTPMSLAIDLKKRIERYEESTYLRLAPDEEFEKQNIIFDINALAFTHVKKVDLGTQYEGGTDTSTQYAAEIARWIDDNIFESPVIGPLKAELDSLELQKQINESQAKRDEFIKQLDKRMDEFGAY